MPATNLNRRLARAALQAAVLTLSALPLLAAAGTVRVGGTGNAVGTMRLLGAAFNLAHPDIQAVVLTSLGSSGAIKAVPKGAIEIGLSSRLLSDEEKKGGLTTLAYAQSPTVLAVHKSAKVTSITLAQLSDIYNGTLVTWPDGSRIRPVMRQPGDDNTLQLRSLSPEIEKASLVADQQPGVLVAVTDQEAADRMESVPGSLGVTTLALIRSEQRNLQPLALGGVEPTPENARSGRYPLTKKFYMVLPKEPSADVRAFVDFVRSPQGLKILQQTGHALP